ncbi:hypothetical protein P8452_50609 [Trifolium repens]|nr:hypothetical protein P8452_50609 [Trifolium repens]
MESIFMCVATRCIKNAWGEGEWFGDISCIGEEDYLNRVGDSYREVFVSTFNTTTNRAMAVMNCLNDEDCRKDTLLVTLCSNPGDKIVCMNLETHMSACLCLKKNMRII